MLMKGFDLSPATASVHHRDLRQQRHHKLPGISIRQGNTTRTVLRALQYHWRVLSITYGVGGRGRPRGLFSGGCGGAVVGRGGRQGMWCSMLQPAPAVQSRHHSGHVRYMYGAC